MARQLIVQPHFLHLTTQATGNPKFRPVILSPVSARCIPLSRCARAWQTPPVLLVVHVENSGPAEEAGVLLGDVLFEMSGKTVEHVDTIQDSLATARVGDVLQVRVIRAGEIKPLSITLGERAR